MTLQSKHSVQQLQQDNVVLSTANIKADSVTETSAVHDYYTQKASCDKYNTDTTETSAVCDQYAQWASHNENDKSVMSEDSDTTETSAVHNQYTQ